MDGTAQVSTVGALIGYRLRDLRKRHKVTQGQVADKVSALLGGDPDETEPIAKAITISMIERGERDVAVWELGALATALRLHPHYLLDTTGVDVAPDVARYADAYGCADKPSPSAQPWEMPAETDEERAARRKRSAEILESRLLRALKSDGIETAEGLREIVWDLNESDAFEWREDLVTKRRQRDGEDPWGANNKDLSTLRMEATKAMIHEMRDYLHDDDGEPDWDASEPPF